MSNSRTHRSAKAVALRKISEVLDNDLERYGSENDGGSTGTTTVSDSDSEEEYEGGYTCGAQLFTPRKTSVDNNSESDSEAYESEDRYSGISEEEEDFYREVKAPGRPPAKRTKLSAASTSRIGTNRSMTRKGRSRKTLSLLPTMPLDVLFEILSQLTPKDLINVSRTNKLFHDTLYSRGARMVWKEALRGHGVPACPRDLIEPRFANLLFGTTCEECGRPNVPKVDFYLRRLGGYAQGHSSNQCFWWSTEIQEVMHMFATAEDKKRRGVPGARAELKAFTRNRLARIEEIDSTTESLDTWFRNTALDRREENQEARDNRLEAIKVKFIELGYGRHHLGCLAYEKECTQKAALTDKRPGNVMSRPPTWARLPSSAARPARCALFPTPSIFPFRYPPAFLLPSSSLPPPPPPSHPLPHRRRRTSTPQLITAQLHRPLSIDKAAVAIAVTIAAAAAIATRRHRDSPPSHSPSPVVCAPTFSSPPTPPIIDSPCSPSCDSVIAAACRRCPISAALFHLPPAAFTLSPSTVGTSLAN
ncbi:hypothetical protein BDN70DRAFT_998375 [Pholiota conissans]|uniref:F-box domain-containing protein n=1 Tax=Pholiota conissans TaxID=109636 RepID=A0A9P5YNW0_9AGAR|nr:hypothetical protein BDN70DRAFT_998375 [Pholiota conissans]